MSQPAPLPCRNRVGRQRGVSLIITLIMLVIIGLTASAAMRGTISSERVVNNMRSEALAQQYAEAALGYCEDQMNLASASRITALQDANLTVVTGTPSWQITATWVGGAVTRIEVPQARLQSVDSSFVPSVRPQCHVQLQTLPDTRTAVLITSRGFSPDYTANATSGRTLTGSVVWLQSMLALN
jgi:type IV pilus assembly protein PilX